MSAADPPNFGGARVMLFESRLADETAALVRRMGGVPIGAPAVVEAPLAADAAVREFVGHLHGPGEHLVVFLTGAAVVRVNVTVKLPDSPGSSSRLDGETTVVRPGTLADTVYLAVDEPTLVTVRLTVWTPARSPMAIDATFMSLGSVL